MTDRELMQQVLQALEMASLGFNDVIRALSDRLAQPEPEPVAWFTEDHREDKSATTYSKKMAARWKEKGWPVTPLYTTPPQREWFGLTDEEIAETSVDCAVTTPSDIYFARAIEAKLKEKNT